MFATMVLNEGGGNELKIELDGTPEAGFATAKLFNGSGDHVGSVRFSGRDNGSAAVEALATTGHPVSVYHGDATGAEAYSGTA